MSFDAPTRSFTVGKQPCADFKSKDEHAPMWSGNRHSCYGPWNEDKKTLKGTCEGQVSLCANCHTDHHEGGYETCPITKPKDDDE